MPPHPQRGKRVGAGASQREIALIETRRRGNDGRHGLGQCHAQARPLQRTGQAAANEAAADDQDIAGVFHDANDNGSARHPARHGMPA